MPITLSVDYLLMYSAEGVQIGHVCSAAGVAGIWTGAHHDQGTYCQRLPLVYDSLGCAHIVVHADDPAGPFWMMKVGDQLPSGILGTLH